MTAGMSIVPIRALPWKPSRAWVVYGRFQALSPMPRSEPCTTDCFWTFSPHGRVQFATRKYHGAHQNANE